MSARIVIEGGGRGEPNGTAFIQAWSRFFERAGVPSKVIRGGSRADAFDKFCRELASGRGTALLLVDSEGAVGGNGTPWEHLALQDRWRAPDGASADTAFLMVQATETWLLADRAALRAHFGQHFRESALPAGAHLEDVPKQRVLDGLKQASRDCGARYEKREAWKILPRVDPKLVEDACPHAKDLFDRLRDLTQATP